jgi:hypothetical protein
MLDRIPNRLLLRYELKMAFGGFVIHPINFADTPTAKFGHALRAQVEERLNFFETGAPPSKNVDAIRKVLDELALEDDDDDDEMETEGGQKDADTLKQASKKEKKKRKGDAVDDEDEPTTSKSKEKKKRKSKPVDEGVDSADEEIPKKEKKKRKKEAMVIDEAEPEITTQAETSKEKKKRRKSTAMDVDEEEDQKSSKKSKPSKEAERAGKATKAAAVDVSLYLQYAWTVQSNTFYSPLPKTHQQGKEIEKKRRRRKSRIVFLLFPRLCCTTNIDRYSDRFPPRVCLCRSVYKPRTKMPSKPHYVHPRCPSSRAPLLLPSNTERRPPSVGESVVFLSSQVIWMKIFFREEWWAVMTLLRSTPPIHCDYGSFK